MPLYVLGLMGMTRRMQHYDNLAWQPWLLVAAVGVVVILVGIACQIIQLVVSIRDRKQHRDLTGDPWNGRTLEWSTASPPPAWNFAVLPRSLRDRRLLDQEATHARNTGSVDAGARVPADRSAQEQRHRVRHRVLCRRHRLCADLAHLVVGGTGAVRRVRTLLVFAFRNEEEIEISAEQIARFERHARTEVA